LPIRRYDQPVRLPGSADSLGFCGAPFWRDVLEFRPLNSWTYFPRQRRFGYAIGRIGCLLSGTATTAGHIVAVAWGMLFPRRRSHNRNLRAMGLADDCRVYPTPIYEFFIWMAIAVLWRMGKNQ